MSVLDKAKIVYEILPHFAANAQIIRKLAEVFNNNTSTYIEIESVLSRPIIHIKMILVLF